MDSTPGAQPQRNLMIKLKSHEPTTNTEKPPPSIPRLSFHGPRRPRIPRSPARETKNDSQQEAMFQSLKGRMGTLVFGDKTFRLPENPLRDIEDVRRIGSGISGEVYRTKHKPTGTIMAAKKMVWLDEAEERKRILMDLNVMMMHRSPNIVTYYGSVIWNNEVWVFMELMETCLERLLKKIGGPIPEDIVCKMTVSILKALEYLKTHHKVIHRDVKPSNILLDRQGNVKLCDFGISGRLVDSQAFTRNAGCAAYMAPERINLEIGKEGYDVRADIWSLGITLVELATGRLPYASKEFSTEFQMLTFIVKAPPPLPEQGEFSPLFYDFLAECLKKEVDKRPHYPELLEHPLIREYESKPVNVGAWFQDISKTIG